MNGSIKIGNVFGIPVRIHLTFLLLVYALSLFSPNGLQTLGIIALTVGCVLLHELGHSLVARGFGLTVADITLWPLGGIARMSAIPENSRIEALIAVAGPAVNFALAGLTLLTLFSAYAFGMAPDSGLAAGLRLFLMVNLAQGTFNLLPAFPMDGGRLLRSFLARRRDWLRATETAVRVGRAFALLFFVGALLIVALSPRNSCLLPLIAVFLWYEGTRELWSVRLRHGVSPFGAAFRFGTFEPGAAPRAPAPPSPPPEPGVARRPDAWRGELPRSGGFSDEEIRRLEADRGPLRRPDAEP